MWEQRCRQGNEPQPWCYRLPDANSLVYFHQPARAHEKQWIRKLTKKRMNYMGYRSGIGHLPASCEGFSQLRVFRPLMYISVSVQTPLCFVDDDEYREVFWAGCCTLYSHFSWTNYSMQGVWPIVKTIEMYNRRLEA